MRRLSILLLFGCLFAQLSLRGDSRPDGWNDNTHGRDAEPDYARIFPDARVVRIDIDITSADWQTVMDDMTSMAGTFGADRQANAGFGGAQGGQGGALGGFVASADSLAACTNKLVGESCTLNGATGSCVQVSATSLACIQVPQGGTTLPGGGGNAGGNQPVGGAAGGGGGRGAANGADDVDIFPRTPVYVPADVSFDGEVFHHVGFRLKGNSSLSNGWRSGVDKLPFRLNFDELEDQYPEIRDQTFFGFPNLSFTSNSTDTSFLRHRVVTDLFRQAGVPAAHTVFARVYMNRGAGSFYMGLYTMTEVPDRPMLDELFGSSAGNLYKPVGTGGRWTQFFQLSYPKKTNAEDEDWTDIQGAIDALNSSRASASTWRARLEARFEVNGFLRWLALNTIVGNTDAYGGLSAHNYYLYGSPRHRDRLFWIAWDHDLAMNGTVGGGGGNFGGGGGTVPGGGGGTVPGGGNPGANAGAVDLFLSTTGSNWPLIRFLLDDAVYRPVYREHLTTMLNTVFEPNALVSRLRAEQALITPYVTGAEGEQTGHTYLTNPTQFSTAIDSLESYVRSRHTAAVASLAVAR